MTTGGQPPVQNVQAYPVGQLMRPHRGVLILVFGIVGIVCCVIFGIIAWAMGSSDLREMNAGRMDPSGRGLTQAGQICGIISVAFAVLGVIIWIIMFAIGGAAGFRSF
jgi:hypothetical protein